MENRWLVLLGAAVHNGNRNAVGDPDIGVDIAPTAGRVRGDETECVRAILIAHVGAVGDIVGDYTGRDNDLMDLGAIRTVDIEDDVAVRPPRSFESAVHLMRDL